jgi:hypothetical protein
MGCACSNLFVCRHNVLLRARNVSALERVVGRRSRYHVTVQLKNRGAVVGAIVSPGMMNPRVVVRSGGSSATVALLLRVVGHDNNASQLANNSTPLAFCRSVWALRWTTLERRRVGSKQVPWIHAWSQGNGKPDTSPVDGAGRKWRPGFMSAPATGRIGSPAARVGCRWRRVTQCDAAGQARKQLTTPSGRGRRRTPGRCRTGTFRRAVCRSQAASWRAWRNMRLVARQLLRPNDTRQSESRRGPARSPTTWARSCLGQTHADRRYS